MLPPKALSILLQPVIHSFVSTLCTLPDHLNICITKNDFGHSQFCRENEAVKDGISLLTTEDITILPSDTDLQKMTLTCDLDMQTFPRDFSPINVTTKQKADICNSFQVTVPCRQTYKPLPNSSYMHVFMTIV